MSAAVMPMRITVSARTNCGNGTLNTAAKTSAAARRFPLISLKMVINPLDFSMIIF
jgi:hypothetical protein